MSQRPDIALNLPVELVESITLQMLNGTACIDWLLQTLHGGRSACPQCNQEIQSERQLAAFRGMKRVCCKGCGRWYDWKTGTILSATTLQPRQVVLLCLLLGIGRSVNEIAVRIGIHEGTVRDWRDRLTTGCKGYDLSFTA